MDRNDQAAATAGTGVTRYTVALVILGVLFVVLAAQNTQRAHVDLLVWDANPPVYAIAIVMLLVGALVAVAGSGVWRHRRRKQNAQIAEAVRRNDADDRSARTEPTVAQRR